MIEVVVVYDDDLKGGTFRRADGTVVGHFVSYEPTPEELDAAAHALAARIDADIVARLMEDL